MISYFFLSLCLSITVQLIFSNSDIAFEGGRDSFVEEVLIKFSFSHKSFHTPDSIMMKHFRCY